MKKSVKTTLLAAAIAACAFAPCISNTILASAGASRSNVASEASVMDGRINTGDFMINGGVHAEERKMIFDAACAESSSVVGKTKINNLGNYGVKTIIQASLCVELNALVENKGVFSVCFGLQGLGVSRISKGVVEMRFYEDDGINFVVYEHYGDDLSNVLFNSRQFEDVQKGDTAKLSFTVSADGAFTLSMNENALIEDKILYEGGDGYFALFSEGKNEVSVSELSFFGYSYDTPENVDYTENFDNGSYNSNVFYSMSKVSPLSPSYLTVENGALKFSNTAGAHITTRHAYSNFEMAFDVTELQRSAVYDEKGNIEKLISNWFSIAFGVDNPDQAPESTNPMAVSLQVEGMPSDERTDQTKPNSNPRLILWDKGTPQIITDMPYNIWDASFEGKVVNVKFSICDGEIKLWMKASEENWGEPVFAYDLGYTPSGHVRLYTWGQSATLPNGLKYNSIANFTIDNLSVKNTDYEGAKRLTTVEYKSNIIQSAPDYSYTTQPDENDLLINRLDEIEQNGGCSSALPCGVIVPLAGAFGVALLQKGRKKDE